jgi:hypothetical protein
MERFYGLIGKSFDLMLCGLKRSIWHGKGKGTKDY